MADWLSGTPSGVSLLAVVGILARFMYWGGRVDSDRQNFKEFMKEVRADLNSLEAFVSRPGGATVPFPLLAWGSLFPRTSAKQPGRDAWQTRWRVKRKKWTPTVSRVAPMAMSILWRGLTKNTKLSGRLHTSTAWRKVTFVQCLLLSCGMRYSRAQT